MSLTRHSIIRLLAAPRPDATGARSLGFQDPDHLARVALDRIPRAVVVGFESALESREVAELVHRVELLDPQLQGFGYEGATMAWTILDATTGGNRVERLLQGPARQHLFLAYIGIGFAMNRLPRKLWARTLPNLDIAPYHPALSWLAVDGYGFDQAYFHRATYVEAGCRPRPWPWLGRADYFQRAADQGIGRALWFIEGADLERTAGAVRSLPASRWADLWSGVGLAATFAGPFADTDYASLAHAAGEYAGDLAVGAVLAARARAEAGIVPEHTANAVLALAGVDVAGAVAVADASAVSVDSLLAPAYELWRQRIASALGVEVTAQGCDSTNGAG